MLHSTDEKKMLIKALKQFPSGTQGDRWNHIATYMQTHARTTWLRTNKEVISKVMAAKDVKAGLAAKKREGKKAAGV
jgi:hypothetical protein